MRVLLIEDNAEERQVILRVLEQLGAEVTTVMDGGQAIDVLNAALEGQRAIPEVILLDLNLPLVSGHEVMRFCKRTPQLRSTTLIILSRLTSENEIQVCYYMGASRYIHKTSDLAALERELHSALSSAA